MVVVNGLQIGIRNQRRACTGLPVHHPQDVYMRRIAVWKRSEEDGVRNAENGGVGTDGKSHGHHCDQRKNRASPEHAQRPAEILKQVIDHIQTPFVAAILGDLRDSPKAN